MKYKVGDKITIKSAKQIIATCQNIGGSLYLMHGGYRIRFNELYMTKFCGKTFKVLNISNDCYVIKDPDGRSKWYFSEQWVELLSKKIEKIMEL